MQLPQFGEFTPDQESVYLTPAQNNLFVVGPPGSGKTTLAIERAKLLSRQRKKVLFVTKNRMLSALANQLGSGEIEVSTMHTFVPKDYRTRLNGDIPQYRRYIYDWPKIMEHYASTSSKYRYEHIIVDEGQNLPQGFYPWLVAHGAKSVTIFADDAQQTDPNQRASIQDILNAPMPEPRHLLHNHRNTREIALVAEHFHRSREVAPGLVPSSQSGTKPRLVKFTDWEELAERAAIRLTNRKQSIGIIVKRAIDATSLGEIVRRLLPIDARVDVYTNAMLPGLEHSIKVMDPGITILTSESVIGLEFTCVYLQDLHRSSSPLADDACRRMYMLCARAKEELIMLDGPTPMTQNELRNLPDERLLTR